MSATLRLCTDFKDVHLPTSALVIGLDASASDAFKNAITLSSNHLDGYDGVLIFLNRTFNMWAKITDHDMQDLVDIRNHVYELNPNMPVSVCMMDMRSLDAPTIVSASSTKVSLVESLGYHTLEHVLPNRVVLKTQLS